jgi:hypothetical protein
MTMRVRRTSAEGEDISGLAGWMYTDLLLALMVVFLATISFVPAARLLDNREAAYVYSQIYDKPLTLAYEEFDPEVLQDDIIEFLLNENLDASAVITQAQFVGAYDADTEDPSVAIRRALAFSDSINKANPLLLSKASTSIRTAPDLRRERVIVQLTFATEVRVVSP